MQTKLLVSQRLNFNENEDFWLYFTYVHLAEHEKMYIECECKWSEALRRLPIMEHICRQCGALESNHQEKDHQFDAMNVEAVSRAQNISLTEYKEIYHEGINLPVGDNVKNVLEMSAIEIVEHINRLEKAIVTLRVYKYAAAMKLVDIEKELTDEQRKILREKSASFKVSNDISKGDGSGASPKVRKPSVSAEEKALLSVMAMLKMSREQALEFIAKNK